MQGIDYWKLCDELSVVQAALLATNHDPAKFAYVEDLDAHERPNGYEAVKTAIKNAILSKKLSAKIKHHAQFKHFEYHDSGDFIPDDCPDWNETTVNVKDLKDFLSLKGCKEGFFFTENKDIPPYLDALHPSYSPKLAATVEVWTAINSNTPPA